MIIDAVSVQMHPTVRTNTLEIGYLESGPENGPPVILLHAGPSDVHDWDGVTFDATAASFDNPDFVAVTIHSYRAPKCRAAPSDRSGGPTPSQAPWSMIAGTVISGRAARLRSALSRYERRVIPRAGHFLPREDPEAVVKAIRALAR